jgi:hypothetical protein
MTNTHDFAKTEFEILMQAAANVGPDHQPIIAPFIPEILALAEKFGLTVDNEEHAKAAIAVITGAIKQLFTYKAICPIEGTPEEWVEVTDNPEQLFQNKRCPQLFKVGENGPAYYLDAIVFKEKSGRTFTGSVKGPNGTVVHSRQFVNFPFTPKHFYIDVTHTSLLHNVDPEYRIKDKFQVDKVYEYYRKPEPVQ